MTRRLLIPLLGSALLLAASAGSALGKCVNAQSPADCEEVMASLEFGGTGIAVAGSETPITIAVSRGERAFEATSVALVFTRLSDETVVSVDARASDEPGMWVAEVALPFDGVWSLVAWVDGASVLKNVDLFRVREPAAPPVAPTTPLLPLALLLGGIAAAALLALAIRDRSRQTVGGVTPSGAAASLARSTAASGTDPGASV